MCEVTTIIKQRMPAKVTLVAKLSNLGQQRNLCNCVCVCVRESARAHVHANVIYRPLSQTRLRRRRATGGDRCK